LVNNDKEVLEMPKKAITENTQINITIPKDWKDELENLARIYSVEEGKTLSHLDLIRIAIEEKYNLG
jgi:hypothetical protein